jgi:aspartyl-tRNA(Asn)/glutamyl-tRNA(Gln) amidotransferase subunit C
VSLDPAAIARLAELARLSLPEDERTRLASQLSNILAYVDQVQAVDVTGVPETSHPLSQPTAWREDEPRPSLDRDRVLAQAPGAASEAGLFRVPKVIG